MRRIIRRAVLYYSVICVLVLFIVYQRRTGIEIHSKIYDFSMNNPDIAEQLIKYIKGDESISDKAVFYGPYMCWNFECVTDTNTYKEKVILTYYEADYHIYVDDEKVGQVRVLLGNDSTLSVRDSTAFRNNCDKYDDKYCVFGNIFYEQYIVTENHIILDENHWRYPINFGDFNGVVAPIYRECPIDMKLVILMCGRELYNISMRENNPQTKTLFEIIEVAKETT